MFAAAKPHAEQLAGCWGCLLLPPNNNCSKKGRARAVATEAVCCLHPRGLLPPPVPPTAQDARSPPRISSLLRLLPRLLLPPASCCLPACTFLFSWSFLSQTRPGESQVTVLSRYLQALLVFALLLSSLPNAQGRGLSPAGGGNCLARFLSPDPLTLPVCSHTWRPCPSQLHAAAKAATPE